MIGKGGGKLCDYYHLNINLNLHTLSIHEVNRKIMLWELPMVMAMVTIVLESLRLGCQCIIGRIYLKPHRISSSIYIEYQMNAIKN